MSDDSISRLNADAIEMVRRCTLRWMNEEHLPARDVARMAYISEDSLWKFLQNSPRRRGDEVAARLAMHCPLGLMYHPPKIVVNIT